MRTMRLSLSSMRFVRVRQRGKSLQPIEPSRAFTSRVRTLGIMMGGGMVRLPVRPASPFYSIFRAIAGFLNS
jgi:hypothetical protein